MAACAQFYPQKMCKTVGKTGAPERAGGAFSTGGRA